MSRHVIYLPIRVVLPMVRVPDKKIALNLNVYRNLHQMTESKVKKVFTAIVAPLIKDLPVYTTHIGITYYLYMGTNRSCDVANICCIVDKYFCDTLTHCKKIEDDSYHQLIGVKYIWGGVDPGNERINAIIRS